MNTIASIISTLSTEEKQSFVATLKRKNKRNDTKNIQLFKLLDTQPNLKELDLLLYKKPAKGAFHALCKRLHDSLIDFIATQSFEEETSEEMEVMKQLLASRIFFEKKAYKIALKTLKKAELKAKKYDLYSILREIYYTKIQYAHLDKTAPLDTIIQVFRENQQALEQEENLNLCYATLQEQLKKAPKNIQALLHETFQKFGIVIDQDMTFRSLYKVLEITNQVAYMQRNFHTFLPFVETTYQQIEHKNAHAHKHLYYHIQILYYVANSYFRNKNFEKAATFLQLMLAQMQEQDAKYHKRFLPQYTLLKAFIFNYQGEAAKAIQLLTDIDLNRHKEQIGYVLDLQLALIVCHFQQSEYTKALELHRALYHSDTWYAEKANIPWVVKKNLIEILLYIATDAIDLVDARVQSFRKKHTTYLKNRKAQHVLDFLSLAIQYYLQKDQAASLVPKIENTFKNLPDQEDIFVISFYAWLIAQTTNTDIYTTTLALIDQ